LLRLRRREIQTTHSRSLLRPLGDLRERRERVRTWNGAGIRKEREHLDEVRDDEGDIEGSVGAIDHALEHELTAADAVLERDRSDVLPVLELVEFLDAARDLEESPVHHHAQVPRVEQAQPCRDSDSKRRMQGRSRKRERERPWKVEKTSLLASSLLR
jgi:hypothetical protein